MGKKPAAKGQPKSQEDAVTEGGDGPTVTGVFVADFPALCEHEGLPAVAVRTIARPQVPEELSGDGDDVKGGGEGTVPSHHAVLVECEDEEDLSTLRAVHVRGWLLSEQVMSVLVSTLSGSQLTSLNLWNVGLTERTLSMVVRLSQQLSLRDLTLDGNRLSPAPLAELLKTKNSLEQLSLRCCGITPSLLTPLTLPLSHNRTLLSLDLSCNCLGDEGAWHLATILRSNRTLLSLGLTRNSIGNSGATHLAEVLSQFTLNHKEIVERRKLLSQQRQMDDGQSLLEVDRGPDHTPRRSPSSTSLDKSGKLSKLEKGSKGKKGESKKEEKGRKDDKGKKGGSALDKKGKGKESKAGKKGPDQLVESPHPEAVETVNPLLMDPLEDVGGQLVMPGNTTLIHLTLAYNQIGEQGVQQLLEAVKVQRSLSHLGPGLLRLTLHHNPVPVGCPAMRDLTEHLIQKDPLLPQDSS